MTGPKAAEAGRLLLVDDDQIFRRRLLRAFRDRGIEAREAEHGEAALALVAEWRPDMVVVDLRMPEMDGLELTRQLLERDPSLRIIALTGYGSIATALEAVRLGAIDYLTKPADADQVLASFARDHESSDRVGLLEEAPSLDRVEWEHIQRVLADCDGNVTRAARVLGIHRRSLQRKLARRPPRR